MHINVFQIYGTTLNSPYFYGTLILQSCFHIYSFFHLCFTRISINILQVRLGIRLLRICQTSQNYQEIP